MWDVRSMSAPVPASCDTIVGMQGSISWVNLDLPSASPSSVLLVQVTTRVAGQSADRGFFVRPSRLTRAWGTARIHTSTSASFYLGAPGQYSVEFASDALWRDVASTQAYDALMLFVNGPLANAVPTGAALIPLPSASDGGWRDLGPHGVYKFANVADGVDYDWGRDMVFKVHDNTSIYFEPGAHVRARLVQTQRKVHSVRIFGFGTLENHYGPWDGEGIPDGDSGVHDDRTRQTIVLLGKNITVEGVTTIHTVPSCHPFGYCLNFNPNWAPLPGVAPFDTTGFDAQELQGNAPYRKRQAHCQTVNMDDSPNGDFFNCPTSHADGNVASNIKCMTWQMGTDGVNVGRWGTLERSFVRVTDDALKVWDSDAVYSNIVLWQLALGWPINLGWWQWNQPDDNALVDSIHVIHNHNWVSSFDREDSGQCTVGAVYGSGAIKRGLRLRNIFTETATSCAVGLRVSKTAFNRHTTPQGCVGSILDTRIDGFFADEPFLLTGNFNDYLGGEPSPSAGCTGELSGRIDGFSITGSVDGRSLRASDFAVDAATVSGVAVGAAQDPYPVPTYTHYPNMNAEAQQGAVTDIDSDGVAVSSASQCMARCQADWSCDCAVYAPSWGECFKRRGCDPSRFYASTGFSVYVRPAGAEVPNTIGVVGG